MVKSRMNKIVGYVVILSMTFFIGLVSCKKDTKCTAIITVTDIPGTALAGASVQLVPKDSGTAITNPKVADEIYKPQTTDASGRATFVLELPIVCKAEATKDGSIGTQTVSFLVGETVEETVIVP